MWKLHRLNSAYMILIPKKEDAQTVGDYRSICLVHSFAKLLTKILANILSPRLKDMVATNQSAFVRGRSIHDNFTLVQHMAKYIHTRRQLKVLLELDIMKAFDSVSWVFLLEVLAHLGFGSRWRNLTASLLSTSSMRVLLNGRSGEYMNHRRGLRQSDPLSTMFFILVMDVLSSLIDKAESSGLLKLLAMRNIGHRMSLYADDVVMFASPGTHDVAVIKAALHKFGQVTGLHTNMVKSSILPIGCDDSEVQQMQQHMNCAVAEFPCKYLGIPLSVWRLTKTDLQPYIDKVADMLPTWKAALMATSGRLNLVRVVLTCHDGSSKPLTSGAENSSGVVTRSCEEVTVPCHG